MDLIIDGKKAVLKRGSSFDYVSENRSFTDADDYTLSITLPLAGCPENLDIFGHLDRMDIESRRIVMDASIVDVGFSKNGVATVVESTDVEVKVQFLEGRSAQNFSTDFDSVYINELDLGRYPSSSLPQYPSTAHGGIGSNANAVALPWVYEGYADEIQNGVIVDGNSDLQWTDFAVETGKLSYQPYLIYIAKKICEDRGYTYDFSQWEASSQRYLLVCNVLPAAWDIPQFARALPHWTVTEFFEELEKILVAEISIDHRTKHVRLAFCGNGGWNEPEIKLENILDAFTAEVSYEDDICRYKGGANLKYRSRGDSKWQLDQCQWLIDLLRQEGKYFKEFQTENDYALWALDTFGAFGYLTEKDAERGQDIGSIVHVIETDRYLMLKVVYGNLATYPNMYFYQWVEINRFGDVIYNEDSENNIEIGMVPARLDTTDDVHGFCLFMAPSGFNEKEELDEDGIRQPMAYSALLKGEPSDSVAEYYDMILLAYWDGHSSNNTSVSEASRLPPSPCVDDRFSLKRRYENYLSGIKVSPSEKLKVSWISSVIPDVRSVFHIRGKRYLCEKIAATFTEDGMSQLLKGEFFAITD